MGATKILIFCRGLASTLFLLLVMCVYSQDDICIYGRVVDTKANGIEYVTLGIPAANVVTITDAEGNFSFSITDSCRDSLMVHHVSYGQKVLSPMDYLRSDSLMITLEDVAHTIDEVMVLGGRKKLSNRGMRIPSAVCTLTPDKIGAEVGSKIEVNRLIEVKEFVFATQKNDIPGLRLSIEVYNIDDADSSLCNVLTHPLYVDIPVSRKKIEHSIIPQERILLNSGSYFVAVRFVDCDESVRWQKEENIIKPSVCFPLFLKDSYKRENIYEKPEQISFNIGMSIIGFGD